MVDKNKTNENSSVSVDEVTGIETKGHVWDGIEELDTPLPRWWLYTFYVTIVWAIIYSIAMPAWPMINSATSGLLGWSTRGNIQADIDAHEDANAELTAALNAANLPELETGSDLHRYAFSRGQSVFGAQCSQCHGAGAQGAVGYPNLLDDEWLWGGSIDEIYYTVNHGIRNETDTDARFSEMSAFGEFLERDQINAVVEYTYSLSNDDFDADLAAAGHDVFVAECASCHGDNAEGMREEGAPNLRDSIWLYGGDRDALKQTVTYARFGVMPAWGQRLATADIRAVSIYVHSLGGGE